MTVTLTYDATLSRVRIDATALAAADYATVERSTDQIRWTTVRGGVEAVVTAGVLSTVDDYEFRPNVVNYYRVRGVETGAIAFVGAGAAATGNNTSVAPAHPGSLVVGDALYCLASIRNSGAGTVNTPAGWTLIRAFGNMALLGRRYASGDVAPTITFTGGAANATTIAQIAAFRRAAITEITGDALLNGSAQNIAYPSISSPLPGLLLFAGWKQDDWTSVATLAGCVEIGETSSTTGDDAGQVWDYVIFSDAFSVLAGSFTVTGGASAISRGMVVALPHAEYLNEQTASTTPNLTTIWLKSIMRPFLNRAVYAGGPPLIPTRAGRGDLNEAVGRSLPIGITDVAGSKAYQLQLRTATGADAQVMDYVIASGDILYLHAPAGMGVPAGGVYLLLLNAAEGRQHVTGDLVHWMLQVQEVLAPGPDVVGATVTHDTLLALYATFDELLAANPTFDDLLDLMGDPSEVIVE